VHDLTPIIIGVGQINDRPLTPDAGMDSIDLMIAALERAEIDAGADLLRDADYLGVVRQIAFRDLGDPCTRLAERIGATPAVSFQTEGPNGDSPIMLMNDAANRIGAGEIRIALVCGAEALRTAAARVAVAEQGRKVDATREASHRVKIGYAQSYGLVAPVDVYPLYENAMRAALMQSFAEAQQESGEIWSLFSHIAAANDGAWMRKPVAAEEIITPSEFNRPIAFPYNKLMVANASVNQGAAFIVTSVGEARARNIDESRWIYVGNGAAAHEPDQVLCRDRFDRSPSMAVSIRKALELNDVTPAQLDLVELYSCFPCIPKLARRIIDWPVDCPASVFGGLTFGGGPIGNYMSHAVVSMVERLRIEGGKGLLFANGGFATHNHSIVISSTPIVAACFPRDFDFQSAADAARGSVPELNKDYAGPAHVESYTVFFRRDGSPRAGVVVARTPTGQRTLAHVPGPDAETLDQLMSPVCEPVGRTGVIAAAAGDGALHRWRFRDQ
jgi:acetyl-CoA C-acetyltransferase